MWFDDDDVDDILYTSDDDCNIADETCIRY